MPVPTGTSTPAAPSAPVPHASAGADATRKRQRLQCRGHIASARSERKARRAASTSTRKRVGSCHLKKKRGPGRLHPSIFIQWKEKRGYLVQCSYHIGIRSDKQKTTASARELVIDGWAHGTVRVLASLLNALAECQCGGVRSCRWSFMPAARLRGPAPRRDRSSAALNAMAG